MVSPNHINSIKMLPSLLLSLAALKGASAWGTLGHDTIAYLAQNYVADSTAAWAQAILADNSSSYLANVATWADSYRYTDAGGFSAPFHYIDAEDDPPTSCNVDFDRDCGDEGCVVSAIANYTQRVQAPVSGNLSSEDVSQALRFLVHFLGDITQPLHDEALALGGNDIDVTFDGEDTNLHHIWDTDMPEQLRGGYNLTDAKDWAENLTAEIEDGKFKGRADSWLEGLDIKDAKASALVWARDANAYVCSVVLPNGANPLETGDLYPEYYNSAIETIELQIAKGGYRLAAWLDAIAEAAGSAGGYKRTVKPILRRPRAEVRDLSGKEFLPAKKEQLSDVKLRRLATGWGCKH